MRNFTFLNGNNRDFVYKTVFYSLLDSILQKNLKFIAFMTLCIKGALLQNGLLVLTQNLTRFRIREPAKIIMLSNEE